MPPPIIVTLPKSVLAEKSNQSQKDGYSVTFKEETQTVVFADFKAPQSKQSTPTNLKEHKAYTGSEQSYSI